MTLKYSCLDPLATAPSRKHPGDAGVDVYASENVTIAPFSSRAVHTGVTFEIPEGTLLQVWPKSRHNHLVGAGVIDAGYQGEVLIKIVNYSWKRLRIRQGDAVAQLVHIPVLTDSLEELPPEKIHRVRSARGGEGGIHLK
jgi:dUTP pyrophosphatase